MNHNQYLYIFGIGFMLLMGAIIVVPYLRKKRDLLLPSNWFLLGSAIYIGYAAIDVAVKPKNEILFGALKYDDVKFFLYGVVAFFVPFFLAYRFLALPSKKIASKVTIEWPAMTPVSLIVVSVIGVIFSILFFVKIPVPVLFQLSSFIGRNAPTLAAAIALAAWTKDRTNPIWLIIFAALLAYSGIIAIIGGGGRRPLVAVLLAIPIVMYWTRLRYQSPYKTILIVFVLGLAGIVLITAYSGLRRGRGEDQKVQGRGLDFVLEVLRLIPSRTRNVESLTDKANKEVFGQRSVEFSMLSRRMYTKTLRPRPYHSLVFGAAVPIPRYLWPSKPEGLGRLLPTDYRARTRATWGPGIVGHGYHDGGLHVLVIYGILAGFVIRILDQYLINEPDNPYLAGILVCISSNLVGWTRGDITTFTVQVIAGVISGIALAFFARFLVGRELRKRPATRIVFGKMEAQN